VKYELRDVVLEITKRCNLRCRHCGSGCTDLFGRTLELEISEWEKVISKLAEMNAKRVVFSGGEPTLKKGIQDLFSQIKSLGMEYGIITNGFCLEDEILNALVANPPYAVGFSIDGMSTTHNNIRQNGNSFGRCLYSITKVKKEKLPVCIVTTVNKWNYRELEDIAKLANDFCADSWQIQMTFPAGRAKKQKDFLIDQRIFNEIFLLIARLRKKYENMRIEAADCFAFAPPGLIRDEEWQGCQAGMTTIGIDAYGDVMPCLSMRAAAICGNVKKNSLREIWKNSKEFDVNRKFAENSAGVNCKDCIILKNCRGGCGSFSLSYNGRFHDAPFCYYREDFKNKKEDGNVRKECVTTG
jgi:radical SAM protein with 4Fe4S-binding SPASM domain